MSEDWLETGTQSGERVPALPIPVELPADYAARAALAETAWGRLSPGQKTFLSAWRDCRFNSRAAGRQLGSETRCRSHAAWQHEPDYALIVRVWRANAAANALDKDRLLARQDDIVETLLTPKPIFHQGVPLIGLDGKPYEEVEAGAASRANETLMKAAGLLKDKELEINVGIQIGPPTLNIQVMPTPPSAAKQNESVAIDAKFTEVPSDDEWLST